MISTMWKLIIVWATLGMCSKPLPSRATCDRGWYVDGIRPSGRYDCRRAPIGDDVRLPSGLVEDRSVQSPGVLDGRIFCTTGQPRVVDERTVECR